MELHEAIRLTIEMEDESFIKDERFVNYLADMQAFGANVSNKNIFKQLCVGGYMDDIFDLWIKRDTVTKQQAQNFLKQKANSVSKSLGFQNDNVLYCLESVAFALQLLSSITVVINDDCVLSADSKNIIGYWDFNFKKGKTMQLTIGRDGYAKASSGTKYRWELSGNEIDIYIQDLVSYKGILDGDIITGTAFSNYNPIGWTWSAIRRGDGMTFDNLTTGEWVIVNDVQDLDDNEVRFMPNNNLDSKLYGSGRWYLDSDKLEIITANEFIKYTGTFVKGQVTGIGRNQISNEWNFKLIKK